MCTYYQSLTSLYESIFLLACDSVCTSTLFIQVVSKNLPLRKWMFLRYKKFCTSASSQVASKITSLLEEVFQSFAEQVKAADDQLNSIEDNSIASKNFSAQYWGLKRQNSEICRRDGPYVNNLTEKLLDQKLTDSRPLISPETPMRVTVGSNVDVGGPRSMDFDTSDAGEVLRPRSSTPRDLLNNQMHSPIRRKSFDMRSNSFEGTSYFIIVKSENFCNLTEI